MASLSESHALLQKRLALARRMLDQQNAAKQVKEEKAARENAALAQEIEGMDAELRNMVAALGRAYL